MPQHHVTSYAARHDTGAATGEKTLASAFVVRDREQVARYLRYASLEDAFDAADLDPTDEIA